MVINLHNAYFHLANAFPRFIKSPLEARGFLQFFSRDANGHALTKSHLLLSKIEGKRCAIMCLTLPAMLPEPRLKPIGSPYIESFIILIEYVDASLWNVNDILLRSRRLGLQILE